MQTEITFENIQNWSLFVQRETARFPELMQPQNWNLAYEPDDLTQKLYQSLVSANDLMELNKTLRHWRRSEMVRVAIRDLKGLAEVKETLQDLSDLAEGLVAGALEWHHQAMVKRFGQPIGTESGQPQKMLVLGMGKLGGQELNFSSDIDLIFVYPEKGYTQGDLKSISNDQFFIRLGQALNKSLTEYTEDGMVYRVDMRLRPFGNSGPLAASFAEMESYYQLHGRAWERYALVKARIIAGDLQKGDELFNILRPFVYRKYVDFSAIESLRELKQMINAEVNKKDKYQNIKLGPGGIREIEFIVQAFQLVHGGRETELQGRSLVEMLAQLVEKKFIPQDVANRLLEAYWFLRKAENRLQEWNDQQTHDLPKESHQQLQLAQSMGFSDYETFSAALNMHLAFVQNEFDAVFAEDIPEALDNAALKEACLPDHLTPELLDSLTLAEPEKIIQALEQFYISRNYTHASAEAVTRFKSVLPVVLSCLQDLDNQVVAFERVLKVIASIMARSVYLVMLKENFQSVNHLLALCALSSWMTEMLEKYPALLDQLLDERLLYEPLEADALLQEAMHILDAHQGDDEVYMNQLRQWRHAQVFRVAAADTTGHVPVMKVSDYLTWIAEAVLASVTEYAWRFMQKRSGLPGGVIAADDNPFMIVGYGKMGGVELGYSSDLDIVFLYDRVLPSDKSDGERALENHVYFMRMSQKIISLLTTFMPTGILYEVDTRLRPNGASGMIVTDFNAFKSYLENKAWVWEHQAFVRTRVVVGDQQSKDNYQSYKSKFISQPRDLENLKKEVVDMRQKMRESLDKSTSTQLDLKQGSGGIVDIEFMVQYLVLAHANKFKQLTVWSDNIRLLETIKKVELLAEEDVDHLIEAYRVYRDRYHRLALQSEKAIVSLDEFALEREGVSSVWHALMEKPS